MMTRTIGRTPVAPERAATNSAAAGTPPPCRAVRRQSDSPRELGTAAPGADVSIRLLGVDPSLSRTGCVVMTNPTTILHWYRCRPSHTTASVWGRAIDMADDVVGIIRDHRVTHAVIEFPAVHPHGHVPSRGHGLANYGVAVGVVAAACRAELGDGRICAVPVEEWTAAGITKRKRQIGIAAMFPQYRELMAAGKDIGGDVADAIGLCLWWFEQWAGAQR